MNQRVKIVVEAQGLDAGDGLDGGITSVENLYNPRALVTAARTLEVVINGKVRCVLPLEEEDFSSEAWDVYFRSVGRRP